MAQLICEDLVLGYGGRTVAEHLSFSLNSGDYLCILGENGSGKSTLMKTILGLQSPLSGRICTGDGLKPGEIGYLPQQTALQRDFPATVREIVLSGCLGRRGSRPFYSREENRIAAAQMEALGIAGLARRCYRELSGGQQQRVLLARALCTGRRMLLLDEPTAGLDPETAGALYRILAERNRQGLTVCMISHDPESALRDASHVLRLGRTPFFGSREEYLRKYPEGGGAP